jgi:uncharacterized repeat protein (TIGR02543 family)
MKKTHYLLLLALLSFILPDKLTAQNVNFTGTELLARPTDHSITVNVVADAALQVYFKYGTISGNYPFQTGTTTSSANVPVQVVIDGLAANTGYFYKMVYSQDGGSNWTERDEHSFVTQRSQGSTFTFTITSDSHVNIMLGNDQTWGQTLANVASESPDFNLDLGDTYAMDNVTSASGADASYIFQRASTRLGKISPSIPLFIASGNHEQEEGWHLDDNGNPANSLPVWGTNARKKYFPSPVPDDFYSGNTDTYSFLSGDQLHEDYYSWQWGDALFIVLDPFWYTTTKPFLGNTGGGEGSDTGSGDRWDWTLGVKQFNWLKQTIQNSSAKYKFVFAHHMVGGSDDYVRGGAVPANLFEWGGENKDGSWGFTSRRPEAEWGSVPVHQLFVANGVSAFFHGHDHQYAYEKRDNVVYQSMPSAGFSGNGFNIYSVGTYTLKVLPSPGHLLVTVTPTQTTVDYIGTSSGTSNYAYTIQPNSESGTTYNLTMAVDPPAGGTTTPSAGVHSYNENTVVNITATPAAGYVFESWTGNVDGASAASTTITMNADQSVTAHFTEVVTVPGKAGDMNNDGVVNSTDALIILSCDAGIDVSQFCPVNCADANGDGIVNSTDALIILSFDAGMSVPYSLGQEGCPSVVAPCPGCSK